MNEIFVFLGIEAAGAAVEKTENQITFENFIVQAENTKRFNPPILQYKKGCLKGWFGKPLDEVPYGVMNGTYNMLYDCLVDVDIITKKLTKGGIVTWGRSYRVSKDIPLGGNNIKALLEKKNSSDYQNVKKCFEINFETLSKLLTTYTYDPTDQVAILNPKRGGKRRTNKKRKG